MSHKQKHQLSDSSTPPSTPLMHFSPCKFSEDSSFPLSVDTRSHCDGIPVKPGLSNGLLQIANSRSFPLTPIRNYSQSLGCVTAEEKIGDIDSRSDFCSLSKLNSPILPNKRSMWTNKYYGSLKKALFFLLNFKKLFSAQIYVNDRSSFLVSLIIKKPLSFLMSLQLNFFSIGWAIMIHFPK